MSMESVGTIMLIDDNPTDRFIHRKLLDIYKIGNQVQEFTGGRAALDYLREKQDSADELPDVILLDVLMPGMNGFDFLIQLGSFVDHLAKRPHIYMLSSTDDERDLRRARANSMVTKMLRKPFSPEALMASLRNLK